MQNQNRLWYHLGMVPSGIALLCLIPMLSMKFAGMVGDDGVYRVAAFALAELCMILAGAGGVAYLINPAKTAEARRWVWINVGLFFASAFVGVALFLKL